MIPENRLPQNRFYGCVVENYLSTIEFKVHEADIESDLKATVAAALRQIDENGYEQALVERGIPRENIHKYGFAFKSKKVLIG